MKLQLRIASGSASSVSPNPNANPNPNPKVLKRLQAWLEWTQSMKAKPKKCIFSGLRHGEPFDPKLKVWSNGGEWFPKFMGNDHFNFLGKGLVKDISDSYEKMLVKQKFNSYTALN